VEEVLRKNWTGYPLLCEKFEQLVLLSKEEKYDIFSEYISYFQKALLWL